MSGIRNMLSHSAPHSVTQRYPEELINVVKSGAVAALAGLVYGGLPAARHARQRYIQISQAEVYTSRVDAVVSEICIHVCMLGNILVIKAYFNIWLCGNNYSNSRICFLCESALGSQCSYPGFFEVWMEMELESGCLRHLVQVSKENYLMLTG